MEWVETTGRSVPEALDAALDQLGVDEQEAEVQILDEPQKGLFGRLRVEARVRARVRPTAPRAKADRRDRRRDGRRGKRGPKESPASKGKGQQTKSAARSQDKRAENGRVDAGKEPVGGGKQADESTTPEPGGQPGSSSNRRRRRRRSGHGGSESQQGGKVSDNENSEADQSLDVEAQREAVDGFLSGLVVAFGRTEAEVSTSVSEEDTIVANVDGEELGLLVGPKGLTLQAVHELTRSVVQRRFVGESHARLHLDVAGYRKRRAEALERFTVKVAEEVLASGRTKALDPMPASDRKIVHDAVTGMEGVQTKSEGDEPRRRVVIERS